MEPMLTAKDFILGNIHKVRTRTHPRGKSHRKRSVSTKGGCVNVKVKVSLEYVQGGRR